MLPLLYPDRETTDTFAVPGEDRSYSGGLKEGVETLARSMGPVGAAAGMVGHIAANIIENPQAYGNLFTAAERQTRLADNAFSQDASIEEAYQRRIDAVKAATGVTLENPQRGGYSLSERDLRRLSADGPIDPAAYRRLAFEGKVRELREAHPDKTDALSFGNIDEEAQAIAKGAEQDYEKARNQPGLDTASSFVTQFGAGAWGQRRDPIFVGSMFAGPTSAVGKTVAARIATSGLFQGLYNMGITALEQPEVQAWRQQIGVRSGMMPAIENVGMAFLSGAIPGVALRGVHEGMSIGAREAVERVLAGNPKPGDIDLALKTAGDAMAPQEAAAARVGESMDEMERVTRPPVPKELADAASIRAEIDRLSDIRSIKFDEVAAAQARGDEAAFEKAMAEMRAMDGPISDLAAQLPKRTSHLKNTTGIFDENLHDDLVGAAQRYGDDPINSPSPAAVSAIDAIEVYHGSPHDFEAFDVTKIGTGEGAQSYGHGLYFAENRGVAESYRHGRYDIVERPEGWMGGPRRFDIVNVDGVIEDSFPSRAAAEKELGSSANLYRARINADREHFLDWDKPLSKQAPYVQDKLRQVMGDVKWEEFKNADAGTALKNGFIAFDEKTTSAKLNEAGIPGIKYLDQGSRKPTTAAQIASNIESLKRDIEYVKKTPEEAGRLSDLEMQLEAWQGRKPGDETRNYVVFDDKLVDITHKNDVPLSPKMQEVADRVAAANPTSKREAQMAASEALEDIGNRDNNTRLRTEIDEGQKFYSLEETFEAPPPEPKSGDVIGHVPWVNEKGEPTTITARQAGNIAKRETELLDVIRECK